MTKSALNPQGEQMADDEDDTKRQSEEWHRVKWPARLAIKARLDTIQQLANEISAIAEEGQFLYSGIRKFGTTMAETTKAMHGLVDLESPSGPLPDDG